MHDKEPLTEADKIVLLFFDEKKHRAKKNEYSFD